jgi:quercetin dioxygenase-like cupin family protein
MFDERTSIGSAAAPVASATYADRRGAMDTTASSNPLRMRGPAIVRGDVAAEPGWASPTTSLDGTAASRVLGPEGFSLWQVAGALDAGASLRWDGHHGDEVVYVQDGAVEVDRRQCPAGGAVVVEAGVAATLTAPQGARLLHFGAHLTPLDDAPDERAAGEHVHVVGPGGTWAQVEPARDTRFYADSTCPTCRVTLLRTGRSEPYESPSHSHSQDELIHVLEGELQLGAHRVGPGDTLAIAKDLRYRFRSDRFTFLNYRRDVSYQTIGRHDPPILEGGEPHGFAPVMDLR